MCLAAEQDELLTKVDDRVVFDGQVVGLVIAMALVRQIARTHGPMNFRRLEVGPYRK